MLRGWMAVERAGDVALVTLLAAMTAVCLMQVVWRYVFSAPLTWSEETANYLLVWCSALSSWQAWRWRSHLGFDLLTARAPAAAQRPMMLLAEAAVGGFGLATAILAERLLELTWEQPSAILELPMAVVYAAWPVSGLLCAGDVLVTWATGRRQSYTPVDIT
ncbi:MAG: TRAP transporter small permease [Gemmatimonadaceae bacterium]|nr:TRAP transporter small permease [Acetobacteraceae bacterium]